jgi:hypothetical protein
MTYQIPTEINDNNGITWTLLGNGSTLDPDELRKKYTVLRKHPTHLYVQTVKPHRFFPWMKVRGIESVPVENVRKIEWYHLGGLDLRVPGLNMMPSIMDGNYYWANKSEVRDE